MANEALELAGGNDADAGSADAGPSFQIGDQVRLQGNPAYLKSADPMPMLRPPDLIDPEDSGTVVELRALEQLAVRFRRGTFLLERTQLRSAAD